jgi:hypothetical protein
MSGILGTSVTGAGGGAYSVNNSLRFRAIAGAYLNRSPGTAGNFYKWTISFWHKRGQLGYTGGQDIINAYNGPSSNTEIRFNSSDQLVWYYSGSGIALTTTQVFRDPSAWYHFVFVFDSQNATASNRARIYVNGVEITTFSTDNRASISNNVSGWNNAVGQTLMAGNGAYVDGYLAEFNNIDGQALTPTSFGETNASTGVWQPKAYAGTYGTNGFYLKFSSIGQTDGLTGNDGYGKDFSGNSNYWDTNNLSATTGATYDAMTDSPTPANSTVGNFATLNPLAGDVAPTDGNLNRNFSAANRTLISTIAFSSGKYYWEVQPTTNGGNTVIGILPSNPNSLAQHLGALTGSIGYYGATGQKYVGGTASAYGATFTNNDVIGVAFDRDAGSITFYKNNVSQGVAATGLTSSEYVFAVSNISSSAAVVNTNFGQRPFTYTPPTGFNRLQTFHLPTPTIGASSTTLANKYFNPVLYTGNGSARTISGVGFQPDFVWIKDRSKASQHNLTDVVRGTGKSLYSNTTSAELTNDSDGYVSAFTSDGFSISDGWGVNQSTYTYVAWNWKANGAGVTNTAGSITSTVSANTTAGFSVVTYTGTGANATVGHGLGVAPRMVITKKRSSGTARSWAVYHASLGSDKALFLNLTNDVSTTTTMWNNTSPTSSVFSVGTNTSSNENTANYVAYCFSEIAGYSRFGSYTGNGSTDGTFVYTGFRPAYVMIKRSSAAGQWSVRDDLRLGYNPNNYALEANQSTAETSSTAYACDLLSNGFKLRTSDDAMNLSGSTYIYMAFAENPFNYSLAR